MILKENNEDWFVLETEFNGIGLSYKDLIEVNRLTREKIIQIERRHGRRGNL